jgi:hypothetical protein
MDLLTVILVILLIVALGGGGWGFYNGRGAFGWLGILIVVVVVLLLVGVIPLRAQEVVTPGPSIINGAASVLVDEVLKVIAGILAMATTAFLAWLGSWLRARFMVQQDKDRADSLNTAVDNAAGGVLNKMGDAAVTEVITSANPAVKEAVKYVEKMNPGDVEYFKLGASAIADKIINSVGKQTAPALAPPNK